MGISAVAALGAATVYSGYSNAQAQKKASDASVAQAQAQQAAQTRQAQADLEQTNRIANEQRAAEAARSAEAAAGSQNGKQTTLTPTVQLAADSAGSDGAASKARSRRAQFRPEYSSGVSI
jgi:hypothetical protein